jgi:hypothetical protein
MHSSSPKRYNLDTLRLGLFANCEPIARAALKGLLLDLLGQKDDLDEGTHRYSGVKRPFEAKFGLVCGYVGR